MCWESCGSVKRCSCRVSQSDNYFVFLNLTLSERPKWKKVQHPVWSNEALRKTFCISVYTCESLFLSTTHSKRPKPAVNHGLNISHMQVLTNGIFHTFLLPRSQMNGWSLTVYFGKEVPLFSSYFTLSPFGSLLLWLCC